jgi:hypothetical protein
MILYYDILILVLQSSLGTCSEWSSYVSLTIFCKHTEFSPSEFTETSFIYLHLYSQNKKGIKHEVPHPPIYPVSSLLGPGISYIFLTHI